MTRFYRAGGGGAWPPMDPLLFKGEGPEVADEGGAGSDGEPLDKNRFLFM